MSEADRERIAGHRTAEEVIDAWIVDGGSEDFQLGFWREMAKRMPERFKTVVKTARPMTDEESRHFGDKQVEFGRHVGKRYDEVPLSYLEWLVERNEELRRYLASRRVRDEDR
jgi:hypothetical protein